MNQKKAYYFSDRLMKQLAQIPNYPVTIVEASSGYGKTTAVREYLKDNLPHGALEYWYTCLGEPAFITWNGICAMLTNLNGGAAADLKGLGVPSIDKLMLIPFILKRFKCEEKIFIVIDNFQCFQCDDSRGLISAFSMHGSSRLHFIFITQNLERRPQLTFYNTQINVIEQPNFFFDVESTAKLCRMEGIRLSEEELNELVKNTEGWVAAIRLQIMNYKDKGCFGHSVGIEQLVETAIWNKLKSEEKDILLSLSVMKGFNARQVAFMLKEEKLPEKVENLLKSNAFIRYCPDKGIFVMHSILKDYLHNRFYHHMTREFQNRVFHLVGKAFAADSQYYKAAKYFLKVKDFDAILSLPVNAEYICRKRNEFVLEFIADMVDQCPEDTLVKYPFTMLMLCAQMFAGGYFKSYQKLHRLIGLAIEKNESLSPDQLCRIKRGFIYLMFLNRCYSTEEIKADIEDVCGKIKKPLDSIGCEVPFTFGSPSLLFLYWREVGQLDRDIKKAEEQFQDYRKLIKGHGIGAEHVLKAEAMLLRGEDNEAEILSYRALYQAKIYQQTCICLSAELVLARIAILRGDVKAYITSIDSIHNYAEKNSSFYVSRMVELCLTAINLFSGDTDDCFSWLQDMESIRRSLYFPAIPYAHILYATNLFNKKRYNELIGLSQAILNKPTEMVGNSLYRMAQLYYYKYLAVIDLKNGCVKQAVFHFKKALELALPDKIYLPLAQDSDTLDLIELTKGSGLDKESIETLVKLCKRQKEGAAAIRKAKLKDKSPLTPREREVAILFKERLSAQEIAEKLYISKSTVKTIIRNVYSKLDIHSRSELEYVEI